MVSSKLNKNDLEVIDLYTQRQHLERLPEFYQFMAKFFPIANEFEPLSAWEYLLYEKDADAPELHPLMLLHANEIIGGQVFEIYPKSNGSLLTYIGISENYRHQGLAKYLLETSITKIQNYMHTHNITEYAIFAEANSPEKVSAHQDVIAPQNRLGIMKKLGFLQVDFPYVQPALSEEMETCKDLLLLTYPTKCLVKNEASLCLPSYLLVNFIEEFYAFLDTYDFHNDPDYQRMMAYREQKYVKALSL